MKKKVTRETEITICDVCDQETDNWGVCAVCGKEICYSKDDHWAYSLGKVRKHNGSFRPPVANNLKICKECGGQKTDLTIEELLDRIMSPGSVELPVKEA